MEPIDEISKDLSWRETELALLKVFFHRKDVTGKQHQVLARASWSLLYAHYEGFAKFCLTLYFERASKRLEDCRSLPPRTKLFALQREIKRIRNLNPAEFLSAVEEFSTSTLMNKPAFPDVDTKSNLWPEVLKEILDTSDIQCQSLESNRLILRSIVGKRNGIAHGESVNPEYSYYVTAENAVYAVMYELAFEVDARLRAPPFVVINN